MPERPDEIGPPYLRFMREIRDANVQTLKALEAMEAAERRATPGARETGELWAKAKP